MKTIHTKVTLILSCLLIWSCSDFLDQEPGSQISINEQLSTRDGMLEAVSGIYSNLEAVLRFENYTVYGDLQGGNLKFSPVPSGNNKGQTIIPSTIENVYNFNDLALASNLDSFYDNTYRIINAVNLLLENLDTPADLSASDRDEIEAQMLAIRAFSHFILTQVYAQNQVLGQENTLGIVYKTRSLQEDLEFLPRLSLDETYTNIIADYNASLELFTGNQLLEGPAFSYFDRNSTKALLSRVYLANQNWQQALTEAQGVIESSGIVLTPQENYIESWEEPLAPISETLLELSLPRDADGDLGNSIAQTWGYTSATSYGEFVASEDLIDLYEEEDLRGQLFVEVQLAVLENDQLVNKPFYFTSKFQGQPGTPVIRLSELYLIAAEAAFKLNQIPLALEYLNSIRQRAGLNALTETENLDDQIFLERRRELAFERHLFFESKRTGRGIVRNDGCLATTCTLDYPSNFFVLPIPQNNLNLNENLIQNEGY
ncbi:RagB/SusD family nutrient uptake outer membrane protein [Leeuwenhoekiella nanhaiensis]|uniref:RagB/SusD family nutrient uptake outer membrane protein n=1 Tax=Leeuwenhoekiella nanhaiensis TaxID=1655491 RepID=A0A2G1VS21_9FLAO|nr:RagB/SusD family nutrient uptake outer membrane protein [Leeuwenhoekiella nanhaiensis]PHQ29566.1 hypothetical protein CJ305_09630 [Leeuwenhoekiella nanhaiensis]